MMIMIEVVDGDAIVSGTHDSLLSSERDSRQILRSDSIRTTSSLFKNLNKKIT